MDLKKLQYLESIHRLGSFTKAANEHFISQPSITKAIHILEMELGVQLIQRTTKSLSFTTEGELFMAHVHRILEEVHSAEIDMQKCKKQRRQTLRLAISTTAGDWLLPLAYSDFSKTVPNSQINVSESPQSQMIEALKNDTLDLAYTIIPSNYEALNLDAIPILQGELCVVMPKGHPLAQYERVPFALLRNEHIFAFPKGSFIRERTDHECERHHINPRMTPASPQMNITFHAIEHGAGISIFTIDPMSHLVNTDRLCTRGFSEPISFDEGFLLKNQKRQSTIMRSFIDYTKNAVIQAKNNKCRI